jgi:iron(III) transport system substrate-binding protein
MRFRTALAELVIGVVALAILVAGGGVGTARPAHASEDLLSQVIEGARQEGMVVARTVGFPARLVERTKREINELYGVDLTFDVGPTGGQARMVAQLLAEQAAGVPVAFDVVSLTSDLILELANAGLVEPVDWTALMPADANLRVIHPNRYGVSSHTFFWVLMYNMNTVPNPPTTWEGLADPQYRGRVALAAAALDHFTQYAYLLGPERYLATLQAIMANRAYVDLHAPLYERFITGEYDLQLQTASYAADANAAGVPTGMVSLDTPLMGVSYLAPLVGAPHPNAAKLVAMYWASPAGQRTLSEEGNRPSAFYPGNFENDLLQDAESRGLTVATSFDPYWLALKQTPEARALEARIGEILAGR